MSTPFLGRHFLFMGFLLVTVLFGVSPVHAQSSTPVILNVAASPTSISSGYAVGITWTNQNASGAAISFDCPLGVVIYKNGESVPIICDVPINVSTVSGTDTAIYTVKNISGATAVVTAIVYPLDSSNNPLLSAPMRTTFTVTTTPRPITTFSVASSSLTSGQAQVFSWEGIDILASNMMFDCVPNIQYSYSASGVPTTINCGQYAFTSDLPTSGSQAVTITNSSHFSTDVTVHMVPKSSATTFDATHALTTTFNVSGAPFDVDPSTKTFSVSSTSLSSGATTTLSWSTTNASGANLQFSCTSGISVASMGTGTVMTTLPCNAPAFSGPLAASSSVDVVITNTGFGTLTLPVTLIPANTAGVYFGTNGKTLNLLIPTPGMQVATSTGITPYTATTTLPPATSPSTTITSKSIPSYVFTKSLKRGSANADVTALQKLLALNPSLYPEGLVTGYFGAATGAALGRFQVKYNIAQVGEAGYGTVGPKTRIVLNSLKSI